MCGAFWLGDNNVPVPPALGRWRYAAAMVLSVTDTDETGRLRHAMVDQWAGQFPTPVEQAMRTVPRHQFLPSFSVEESYAESIPVTHRDADGAVLSCATLPVCMAEMLELLDVRPSQRVLEIGAGTGYNAALLAHLTGPDGRVTTIDNIPAVVDAARDHLNATGNEAVRVICGDGADGDVDDAPFDRIIVTAGAWDIPPAWPAQAAPGARIVLPLRIAGFTYLVALERDTHDGRVWRSAEHSLTGFVHLRGPRHHPEHDVPVVSGGEAQLRLEADLPIDTAAVQLATTQPHTELATGVHVRGKPLTDLELWLASLSGVGRLICRRPGHGLVPAIGEGGSLAVLDRAGDTFAYFTTQAMEAPDGPEEELVVIAYGPHADELVGRVTERTRAWAREHPTVITWIEIHPVGTTAPPPDALLNVEKEHVEVIVRSAPR